jgi:hypothetical protein
VADAVEIEADRVEWSAGAAAAEGAVRVTMGDERLDGVRATWDGERLVVEQGVYTRSDGVLAFERAEVWPRSGAAVLFEARAERAGASVEAERIEVGARWEATGATVVPCACADGGPPALSFRAARLTVVPERVVIVHGGVARVFGAPILPIPLARVPLSPDRFRLRLPELGWGSYGPSVGWEAQGGVAGWTFRGGPAWRADRGARGTFGASGPEAELRAAAGWDAVTESVRGLVVTRGGVDATARAAWDITWISDTDYLSDFAVEHVARGVAWRESRAVVGWRALSLDAWLPDDESAGTLARLRYAPTVGRAGARVSPRVGMALVGTADAPVPVVEVGAAGGWSGGLPWLTAELRGDLAGRAAVGDGALLDEIPGVEVADPFVDGLAAAVPAGWGEGASGGYGWGAASLSVPVWSTAGRARFQWWPGVRAEGWASVGLSGATEAVARVGPALRAQAGLSSGSVGLDAAALYGSDGWQPAVRVDADAAGWSARVELRPELQAAQLGWGRGPVTLKAGGAHAADLWLTWGDAALAVGRLRLGGGAAWDLAARRLSGADARVGYDDGCAAATVSAAFSADRPLPDLGLSVTLRK